MSKITTHILNTTTGKPADDVKIVLSKNENNEWVEIGSGITNDDGRSTNLVSEVLKIEKGIYKLKFLTSNYFIKNNVTSFYPFVEITFEIKDDTEHFHVPLLLNPFGYTTYRGS
jgi:5-hydroxyisourate hydrolase